MPTLTLTFPGKRYHATPWGSHVNEGQIEWPPSPWRLLRALLATGLNKLGWSAVELPMPAIELFEALASKLPVYDLPVPLTAAHTRHYMPIPGKTTKVFDSFARIGDDALRIGWDVELSAAAFLVLAELAEALGYLGRAESWVSATVTPGPLADANCEPFEGPELAAGSEPIPLLAPMTPASFETWRTEQAKQLSEPSGGRRRRDAPTVPATLLDCLLGSTEQLHREGWSAPPGSRRVLYGRPAQALVAAQPRRARRRPERDPVECALIALSSPSAGRDVLPPLRLALPQMEALHRGLTKVLGERTSPALTGRGPDREPLQEGHSHAHFIPLSLGDRRRDAPRRADAPIDHVLIYAPRGLDDAAQEAIGRLRWIRSALAPNRREDADQGASTREDRRRLTTTLVATGALPTIREAIAGYGDDALFNESTVWTSHTPFVAPRFVKRGHSIETQIRAELASRGLPEPVSVTIAPREELADAGFATFARRRRRGRPQPPTPRPWSVQITFESPLAGHPVALGYASHFGLGIFRPVAPR